MRKLGIRFKSFSDPAAPAVPVMLAHSPLVEVYDIESGDRIDGVYSVAVGYDIQGVVEATVKFYPVAVQGFSEAEIAHVRPPRR